jgi:hypothetical protein
MKFLQVITADTGFLRAFRCEPQAENGSSWRQRVATLICAGCNSSHVWAPYLSTLGWSADTIVANDLGSQVQWAREHLSKGESIHDLNEIVRLQIETIRPDVLFLQDPVAFDSAFVRGLSFKPQIVVGWGGCGTGSTADVSSFDLMLTSSSSQRRSLLANGARRVERFSPGFPREYSLLCKDRTKTTDMIFVGRWEQGHESRNKVLLELSKSLLRSVTDVRLSYHLCWSGGPPVPSGVAMHDQGELWGVPMYQALGASCASFHHSSDSSEHEFDSERLFETTGMGAALFVNEDPELSEFFEPDREIITFSSVAEFLEKFSYFLRNPIELAEIGRRGQLRCLVQHSMERRAESLSELLKSVDVSRSSAKPRERLVLSPLFKG